MHVAPEVPFVESLKSLVRDLVAAEFAKLSGATNGAPEYRTRGGVLAPGCRTGRAMRARIRRYGIPHWSEGTGTHAVLVVRAVDWHAAITRPGKTHAPAVKAPPTDDEALAQRALEHAGLRPTRRAANG